MNHFFSFFIIVLSLPLSVLPVTIVHGDDSESPQAFTAKINTQAFDPLTGMFFVGLQPNTTHPQYALSRATRPTFDRTEAFTPIGQDSALAGKQIDLLTISPQPNGAPFLPLVIDAEDLVHVATSDGLIVESSNVLNDSAGATTNHIDSIASSASTIFAAVSPNAGNFLDANSGIAVVKIVTVNNVLNSVQTKDATTGLDGNLAAPLNVNSTVVTAGTAAVTEQGTNAVSLYYDPIFDRLYIGLQVTSGTVSGNVANSIVVGQLTNTNVLNFYSSAPAGALANGTDGIVITKSGGTPKSVTSFEPKVMHTSTGPDYLIVNGGPDIVTNVGNTVYALPLVNNPATPTVHGTLAKKDAPLTNDVFTIPAANPGDLPVVGDPAAIIGTRALPTAASNTIADIQVYGDTVYVALNEVPGATTDAGLFSSQALFDATGKIIDWTPWQFHLVPVNAFPNSTLPGGAIDDGPIKFFAIDQQNSNIWIVEGTTDQTVGVTQWNEGFAPTDMIQTINSALPTGAYSVLDLPYHTNGFQSTTYRYALFGGNGAVTFMVTSQANGVQEIPTSDFSTAGTVLTTQIPGTARVLEYSRQVTGNGAINYFFAGTQQGLFAFTDSVGNGFNVNTLGLLNATPFDIRSWYQVTTITGEPIAIKSSGNGNLYVLTRTLTANPLQPFTNTLYSIPFATTTGTMFAPGNIRTIAQTGTGAFDNTIQFFDITIIATGGSGNPATKEQLVLGTNQGLYYSDATQAASNGIIDATNQATANWTLDDTTATTMFQKIQSPNTPIQNTVWPLSVEDASGLQTFDNGSIHQFSGSGNILGTAITFNNGFIPTDFNSKNAQPHFSIFNLLEGFWTDGARRMVISKSTDNPSAVNRVSSSPLSLAASNLSSPLLLNYPVINSINHFYWLAQVGATGQLLAGTDQGVIGLS